MDNSQYITKKIHYVYYNEVGEQKSFSFYKVFRRSSGCINVQTDVEHYLFNDACFPQTELQYYWFDDDGDQIELITIWDFEFYLNDYSKNNKAELWVKPKNLPTTMKVSNKHNSNNNHNDGENIKKCNKNVYDKTKNVQHVEVYCDNCLMRPIKGFRYKCVECPNYDICENCEHKHAHAEHMMIRMPNDKCKEMLADLLVTSGSASGVASDTEATNNESVKKGSSKRSRRSVRGSKRKHSNKLKNGFLSLVYEIMNGLAEGVNVHNRIHKLAVKVAHETAKQAQKQVLDSAMAAMNSLSLDNTNAETNNIQRQNTSKENDTQPPKMTTTSGSDVTNGNQTTENKSSQIGNDKTCSEKSNALSTAPLLPLETLLDPKFLKTGIQILNNFSDMFSKMLDPIDVDNTKSKTTSNDCNSATSSNVQSDEPISSLKILSNESLNTSTSKEDLELNEGLTNDKYNECHLENINHTEDSDTASFIILDAPTEEISTTNINDKEKLDENNSKNTKVESPNDNDKVRPTSYVADYAAVRDTLKAHMDQESNNNNNDEKNIPRIETSQFTTPTTNASNTKINTSTGSLEEELRAVIVYHTDPAINAAITQMILMGFSNENDVLTYLMESVNGNIWDALDLMSNAHV